MNGYKTIIEKSNIFSHNNKKYRAIYVEESGSWCNNCAFYNLENNSYTRCYIIRLLGDDIGVMYKRNLCKNNHSWKWIKTNIDQIEII